ncbi:MAG: hypothetical protein HY916_03670 [Desulfovibrio sp.]|jgi:hypothetical protein|nr:hypothetical protein [Desulfovibrio sp.]
MSIFKKSVKLDAQLNIKVSQAMCSRYHKIKARFKDSPWEFSLQPDFSDWLDTQMEAAEKVLAEYEEAKEVSVIEEVRNA